MTTTPSSATLINIESLINNSHTRLTTLQNELRQQRDMLSSVLDNDSEYRQLATDSEKVSKLKKIAQAKVYNTSEAKRLLDQIRDNQSQIRELKVALSDYLTQYITQSGSRQIEAPTGELFEIIYSARLTKAK